MRRPVFVLALVALASCKRAKQEPHHFSATVADGVRVYIASAGIKVSVKGENVAPGCTEPGPGYATPRDFGALTTCLETLKKSVPALAAARSVEIGGENGMPYADAIAAIDASRKTSSGAELFPDFIFSPPTSAPPP